MTLPKFALDYRKCSAKELSSFISARTGQDAPKGPKGGLLDKRTYATALRKLDLASTFPLFELAAELRNLIYEELLTHDRSQKRRAFPAILRISRQVHEEAQGVLLAESVLFFDASFVSGSGGVGHVQGDRHSFTYTAGADYQNILERSMVGIKNAYNLRIHVTLDLERPGDRITTREMLAKFLETLRYSCAGAKKVTLELICEEGTQRMDIPSLLWPLMWFSENAVLQLEGLGEEEEEEFWKMAAEV